MRLQPRGGLGTASHGLSSASGGPGKASGWECTGSCGFTIASNLGNAMDNIVGGLAMHGRWDSQVASTWRVGNAWQIG